MYYVSNFVYHNFQPVGRIVQCKIQWQKLHSQICRQYTQIRQWQRIRQNTVNADKAQTKTRKCGNLRYIATEGRPRRDAIANLKCFWASDTKDLISMVTFTFNIRRSLIWLASASFISSCLATFVWVRFPCATCGKHNAEFTKDG